ncbi:uncharacterized protein DSM5745_00965 [Aspergillus mulundensis]|uniref:Zn(2)-C6 fungal-type domain-containing protein n=1 Tax=Aspergillus mulundensis TaxID=1810919 RepID=A0A3D8T511_9EURO|nr:hypothetical protein DSM5745_00965 [Aspergillus mulundensis]RDW93643.1 hypothetical protein DSM5745_00965 [Aspergillus mulundensis]
MPRDPEQAVEPVGKNPVSAAYKSLTKERHQRVRHIRCDESPGGQCQNCVHAGWQCEGYNVLDRMPRRHSPSYTYPQDIGGGARAHIGWPMTADERRSFAFFQHNSITSLTALFESPLWQRHILQMSHADPAVFHAVTMLSAAHQGCELKYTQSDNTSMHRAYCFSLHQSSRAMRMLTQRLSSQDPELRHIALLCSLLFGLSDVLLARHDSAWTHFRSGLRILKEIEHCPYLISKVEPSLVAVYRRISLQAALYSNKSADADANAPRIPMLSYALSSPPKDICTLETGPFTSLSQMQSVLLSLLDTGIPLIATGLSLSDPEFAATYNTLSTAQSRLLRTFAIFIHKFNSFRETHSTSPDKHSQQSTLDLLHLLILGHTLSLKIALTRNRAPLPPSFLPQVNTVLDAHESYIQEYEHRPTRVADHGVSANMYLLATRAPDLATGLRAVKILKVWPKYVGFHSSTSAAPLAMNVLMERFGFGQVGRDLEGRECGGASLISVGESVAFQC